MATALRLGTMVSRLDMGVRPLPAADPGDACRTCLLEFGDDDDDDETIY